MRRKLAAILLLLGPVPAVHAQEEPSIEIIDQSPPPGEEAREVRSAAEVALLLPRAHEAIGERANVYYFSIAGCPSCALLKRELPDLRRTYPEVGFRRIDIGGSMQAQDLMLTTVAFHALPGPATPLIFAGGNIIGGFPPREGVAQLKEAIETCPPGECIDWMRLLDLAENLPAEQRALFLPETEIPWEALGLPLGGAADTTGWSDTRLAALSGLYLKDRVHPLPLLVPLIALLLVLVEAPRRRLLLGLLFGVTVVSGWTFGSGKLNMLVVFTDGNLFLPAMAVCALVAGLLLLLAGPAGVDAETEGRTARLARRLVYDQALLPIAIAVFLGAGLALTQFARDGVLTSAVSTLLETRGVEGSARLAMLALHQLLYCLDLLVLLVVLEGGMTLVERRSRDGGAAWRRRAGGILLVLTPLTLLLL